MMGSTSLNPAIECAHLRAASHSFIAEVHNLKESLNQLLELQVISSNTHQKCLGLLSLSLETDIPLIVHADFRQFEYNDRFMYFSVKTQKPEYFSKFFRVRVTFDCEQGNWSCKCPLSTEKKSCLTRLWRSGIYYKFIWNYFFNCSVWFYLFYLQLLYWNDQFYKNFVINVFAFRAANKPTDSDKKLMEYLIHTKCMPSDIPQFLLLDEPPPELFSPKKSCVHFVITSYSC